MLQWTEHFISAGCPYLGGGRGANGRKDVFLGRGRSKLHHIFKRRFFLPARCDAGLGLAFRHARLASADAVFVGTASAHPP